MRWSVACLILLTVGCNKSTSESPSAPTPTAPTPTPIAAPAVPPGVTFDSERVSGLDEVVVVRWNPVDGATSYLVDVARNGEVTSSEVTDTTFDVTTPGTNCVGVRAKNAAGTSGTAGCRLFVVFDMRDVIEALFFNTGPYGETETIAPLETMWGWPLGMTIPVIVGSNVPSVQHAAISRVAEQFTRLGINSFPVVPSSRIEGATYELNKIRAINPPAEQRSVLCPPVGTRELEGCAKPAGTAGTYSTALLVLWANTPYLAAHEFAHTLGISHVKVPNRSGIPTLLMQTPRPVPEPNELSPVEIEAIKVAYANGFHNGTAKRDFIARGLVHQR